MAAPVSHVLAGRRIPSGPSERCQRTTIPPLFSTTRHQGPSLDGGSDELKEFIPTESPDQRSNHVPNHSRHSTLIPERSTINDRTRDAFPINQNSLISKFTKRPIFVSDYDVTTFPLTRCCVYDFTYPLQPDSLGTGPGNGQERSAQRYAV